MFRFGSALRSRYDKTGRVASLDTAVRYLRAELMLTPTTHPDRTHRVLILANALLDQYRHKDDPRALEESIELLRVQLERTKSQIDRTLVMANLGTARWEHYARFGESQVGDQAIENLRTAAASPGEQQGRILENLSGALTTRFDNSGDLDALDEAVRVQRKVLTRIPRSSPDYGTSLASLGSRLWMQYTATGNLELLDEAISLLRDGVRVLPRNHRARPLFASNLGGALHERYELTHDSTDLFEAVRTLREAVSATPADDSTRMLRLHNLGSALSSLYGYSGSKDTLNEAVAVQREAVALTPPDHPNRGRHLARLASVLASVHGDSQDHELLTEAIATHQRAISETPPTHPDRAGVLSALGKTLSDHSKEDSPVVTSGDSVAALQAAADEIPAGRPNRDIVLYNLGCALQQRWSESANRGDFERSYVALQAVVESASTNPRLRIAAGRCLGDLAAADGDWQAAAQALSTAIEALPMAGSRRLPREDQEYILSQSSGMASDAAAFALEGGASGTAVELLEGGRGVLLTQALELQTDLTDLRRVEPELADKFLRVSANLNTDDSGLVRLESQLREAARYPLWRRVFSGSDRFLYRIAREPGLEDLLSAAGQRRSHATEWQRLLDEIRAKPTLERFLLPPRLEDILSAASGGPVIALNISRFRSDALIVSTAGVRVLPLPRLSLEAVNERVDAFRGALEGLADPNSTTADRKNGREVFCDTLDWLWETVSEPVLGEADCGPTRLRGSPQRIWWMPTGPLNFLPIHAAGWNRQPQAIAELPNGVISSYAPTLRALTHGRHRPPTQPRQLVVAVPRAPGQQELPETVREAKGLLSGLPESTLLLGDDASREQVSRAIPGHSWVHFACHAFSDSDRPSNSHLTLADGTLSIVELSRVHANEGELAFLSACSTVRGGHGLPDEAIHLSAAFQLVGYAHVIATQWPVADAIAARVSRGVYSRLAPLERRGGAHVAIALHDTLAELRRDYPKSPWQWAGYVHAGP